MINEQTVRNAFEIQRAFQRAHPFRHVQIDNFLEPEICERLLAPHRPEGWQLGKSTISEWQKYSYNHVPGHIQYFSRESMKKLADRSGCNLCYWEDNHENGQAFEAWLA